LIQ
jgi:hypothetical protein